MGSVGAINFAGAGHENNGFLRGGGEDFGHIHFGFWYNFARNDFVKFTVIIKSVANFCRVEVFKGGGGMGDEESFVFVLRIGTDDGVGSWESVIFELDVCDTRDDVCGRNNNFGGNFVATRGGRHKTVNKIANSNENIGYGKKYFEIKLVL